MMALNQLICRSVFSRQLMPKTVKCVSSYSAFAPSVSHSSCSVNKNKSQAKTQITPLGCIEKHMKRSISVTPDTALKYMEKDKHSHTKEWIWERGTSIALLACFPAAFVIPFPIVDFTLTTLGVFHGHLGMEAVFTDYAHSHGLRKFFNTLLYLTSFFIWGALSYFNYSDVGICGAVKLLWTS
ncbi:succinate dehydrogenase [ubiquinone] cytochrome b small subunit A, mitochondrial-like [Convolutriloba macropyga]|uniref:succinate dehydrogenase [ubiquinone] cytochrome b small subunit A, mitochondrial-like n=1 Tax=Convolutriloba macropyga TaxID=536237 RepID=UPI003F5285C6